jgi:hypothetical protein
VAVRSELLASGRRTDATLAVVYTTPDGDTTILKDLVFFNLSTTATVEVLVAMDAGAFNQTVFFEQTLAARQRVRIEAWTIMPPFCELAVRGEASKSFNYWISGAELQGVST